MIALVSACVEQDRVSEDSGLIAGPVCDPPTLTLAQDFRPEDLPAQQPLDHQEPGVALGDFDGDDDLDALVAWAGGSFGLRNDGSGFLAVDPGFDLDGGLWFPGVSVATTDLDGDGDLDLFLGEFDGADWIAWNDGQGHFRSQSLSVATPGYSSWTGAWGDADGDGDLDLYVARRVTDIDPLLVLAGESSGPGNYLYVNDGAWGFVRDDTRIPQEDNHGLTFHGAWVDVDADGDLDLYEANDWGFYIVPNRLLLNDGNGHFAAATDCLCDTPMYGMGVAVGDVDADTLPDLYVTDVGSPNLFHNQGEGRFADATVALGADIAPSDTNLTSWGTAFYDADLNGCTDLVAAYGRLGSSFDDILVDLPGVDGGTSDPVVQSNVLLLNDCGPEFRRATGTDFDLFLDRDRSVAVGDLDGDGRPDLVTAGKDFVRVWAAGGGCPKGVTVRLEGAEGNPAGIGSRVSVAVNGRTQVQWMLPSTTHSQSALELYFGLGHEGRGDVSVVWPDGSETVGVAGGAGETVTVRHGDG